LYFGSELFPGDAANFLYGGDPVATRGHSMPIMKLTKRTVDGIQPTGRRFIVYDTELKGFGLKVTPSGSKTWSVEYRGGARGRSVSKRRMVLGPVTTLTPDEARNAARAILARVALGEDPAAARERAREIPSFREFAERYLLEDAEAKLKPKTVVNYRIYLRKHAYPALGSIKLNTVNLADVAKLHRRIGQTKPMTANRVVECIGSVYRYAGNCGLTERGHNPAAHVEAFQEQRRERFLSSEELARLGEAIREAETTGIPWEVDETKPTAKHIPKERRTIIGPFAAAALRLLVLTGARLREILDLKWEYVDIERGLLLLPDSKTGRKTIVLNAPALAILSQLSRMGAFVIMGDHEGKPRHDLHRPWSLVCKRAGLEGVRLHDLRHTHASVGAAAGLGLPIIGKLLGHASTSTTNRYAHLDADPLRRASDQIAGRINAAMGEATTAPGEVIQLISKTTSERLRNKPGGQR
jgi:integrase